MDKKNTIIGILLLIAAFYFMYDGSKREAAQRRAAVAAASSVREQSAANRSAEAGSVPAQAAKLSSPFAPEENFKEEFVTLKNDSMLVRFTNRGGAIRNVELLKYEREQNSPDAFIFNDVGGGVGAMGLAFEKRGFELPVPFENKFALIEADGTKVIYQFIEPGKFKITRTYVLLNIDKLSYGPYVVAVKTEIENISKSPLPLGEVYLCLGAAPPTESDTFGSNLAFGLYGNGKIQLSKSSAFTSSSGFLGIGATSAKPFEKIAAEDALWGTVKNQFFAAVFTPENATANAGFAIPVEINPRSENRYMRNAIAGYMGFAAGDLNPGQTWSISGAYYVGPKHLDSLYDMGNGQEAAMDYGWFGFISSPLSRLMNWIHSGVAVVAPDWAWGWSIIILTVIVRLALWPLNSIQIRSAKRMAKLQGPIKEIREKYKNDPQKMNQETMKLYGEYGINPLAGCLPLLIQLPIFIGLYYMLQTSGEIRFAHFLWIKDLSLPDTISSIPSIFGIPFHLLPLINAAVTFLQMHLSLTPSADKTQAMILKLMPVLMLFFFYYLPSGLVLYCTVQSLLGIVQTLMIRYGKDNVELKKRTKPTFMQKLQMAAEKSQQMQQKRGPEFDKLSFTEKLKVIKEENAKIRQRLRDERLKGTMYEQRKKNPGGRSTPRKRK